MIATNKSVKHDRIFKSISFDGKVVIDYSNVPPGSEARISSQALTESVINDAIFFIDESDYPFRFQLKESSTGICFSPKEFIIAVVENQPEIQGLLISNEIENIYDLLCVQPLIQYQ